MARNQTETELLLPLRAPQSLQGPAAQGLRMRASATPTPLLLCLLEPQRPNVAPSSLRLPHGIPEEGHRTTGKLGAPSGLHPPSTLGCKQYYQKTDSCQRSRGFDSTLSPACRTQSILRVGVVSRAPTLSLLSSYSLLSARAPVTSISNPCAWGRSLLINATLAPGASRT